MIVVRRDLRVIVVICGTVLMLLFLAACGAQPGTPNPGVMLLVTPAQTAVPCEACAQATLAVALTQERLNADFQAAATAEIVRANALATINSANATLNAALTQEQNNANVIAAQIAATAEIVRAQAQATLNSAASTQSAALTQDAIRQTQMADQATTSAQSILNQQNTDALAAGTQTAIANNIATQTQVAAATSQWYVDQTRQRAEQRQGPIAFLWMWFLPIFVVLLAAFFLWGFWRFLKIQQANQRIAGGPLERLEAPAAEVRRHRHDDPVPYIEDGVIESGYQVTTPDDHVGRWLDEVKDELLSSDEKDKDDDANA